MKKVMDELKQSDLVNNFELDISFSCLEKPKCILEESLRPNAAYYYLLFKELKSQFFTFYNKSLSEFIQDNVNVNYSMLCNVGDNFFNDISHYIDTNSYIILPGDLYFEAEAERFYRTRHNIHYSILKGYDSSTNKYLVIDEDYTKDVFDIAHSRKTAGMYYVERWKDRDLIRDFCCNIHTLDFINYSISNTHGLTSGYYLVCKAEWKPGEILPCDIDELMTHFNNYLAEFCDRSQEFEEFLISDVDRFMDKFDSAYKDRISEYMADFKKRYGYIDHDFLPEEISFPEEMFDVFTHFYSLQAQRKVFELKLADSTEKCNLLIQYDGLIRKYSIIRDLVRKSLLAGSKSYCISIVSKYLKGISSDEYLLHRNTLQLLYKISNDLKRGG